ncbi:hypothetical protein ACSI5F_03630 [Ralstonia pseudosolanacearum]|uniref:hypothetical protein n=1 Tax=Ralstonia pseudosolanacearum TaxID=1310165 RepID=UPI003EE21164
MSLDTPTQIVRPAASAPSVGSVFPNSVFNLGAAAVAVDAQEEPSGEVVTTPAPAPTGRRASQLPRVSRAIEYLRTRGPCNSHALIAAMGFASHANPRPYLKGPLDDGRIVCVDGLWSLGPALMPKPETVAVRETTELTPAPVPAPIHSTPVLAQAQIGSISLALHVDGSASITANGTTLRLSPADLRFVRTFEAMVREHAADGDDRAAPQ